MDSTLESIVAKAVGMYSRYTAADILERVAEDGRAGSFPDNVSGEEMGYALGRLCVNAADKEILSSIIKGFQAYQADFQRRLETVGEVAVKLQTHARRQGDDAPPPAR